MNEPSRPILILGTGPYAEEIADVASDIAGVTVGGFVENRDRSKAGDRLMDHPVYWIDDVPALSRTHAAVCSFATPNRTEVIAQIASFGVPFATLVHPSAHVSSRSTLAEGVIVCPGVVVASHAHVGRHVRLNRMVGIGHHTVIGDYATVQPGVNVAGLCDVGERVVIGIGATVLDRVRIGAGSVVAAGSVVVKDVPEGVQVVGVPARVTRNVARDAAGEK